MREERDGPAGGGPPEERNAVRGSKPAARGAYGAGMAHTNTGTVRSVVSLVPSLTEALAATAPELLTGATDWCSHPPGLDVTRVRGTKNPDLERIASLAPDLVVANEEENRGSDLDALRAAGIEVLVTEVRSLPQAFGELERMLTRGCGLPRPGWLREAEDAWHEARAEFDLRAVVPVWRRPWMVLGRDTFAGALLAHLGVHNVYETHPERYPRVTLQELNETGRADLVVLPDEPYAFTAEDGPEAFPELPAALVCGRHLTWYGPSLTEAPAVLAAQLRKALD
ncbi:ABC-type Fe3+-hydroxamate transport system, substrate-binding protein [Streptomyces sp. WMMB 714]|nr:ABC-type Fe3+-hydroxamate transport system, substrate-binding protein [Streptomyces sp. WMMB 714]